jgi:dipeptidyl aminopeptidase/acylaminoacyl peptidase
MGQVRRLKFKTEFGVEATAHLVLPPDSKPGDKHPLVVVQYDSEGFLRGGTGDEVPIHVLAGRGIAVLSYQRTYGAPGTSEAKTELEYRRLARRDNIDRRNVQSAIETGIAEALATGRIDGARLGISGLSEGTSATQWALINSKLFKVASLGVCCVDKVALPMNGGIDYEKYHEEMGSPLYSFEDQAYWAPYSLVQNVKKVDAPILVQSGEWLMGLDVQAAFRRAGKVMELHVFENEPHFKFQPVHRYAMYDRVVDWFAFWLKGERDCRVEKVDRYKRWLALPGAPSTVSCVATSVAGP